ncbi:MAG: CopG family transcriptional regulator [Proteobacteria bacterium]|nr:CopG family transcriptional regulator [Pseudomonadota bacterium]
MHRTTIMLPEDLKARSERQAKQLGISLGALIRDALAAYLSKFTYEIPEADPLFVFDNAWQGEAPKDTAANHDSYLYGDKK